MKRKRYSDEQIAFALRWAEGRTKVKEIYRKLGVRYGYRRLHVLLRRKGSVVSHEQIHRLYAEEGLSIRTKLPRRKRAWHYREGRPEAETEDRTLARLHHALTVDCREQAGREASPTIGIVTRRRVPDRQPEPQERGKGGSRTRPATTQARS